MSEVRTFPLATSRLLGSRVSFDLGSYVPRSRFDGSRISCLPEDIFLIVARSLFERSRICWSPILNASLWLMAPTTTRSKFNILGFAYDSDEIGAYVPLQLLQMIFPDKPNLLVSVESIDDQSDLWRGAH